MKLIKEILCMAQMSLHTLFFLLFLRFFRRSSSLDSSDELEDSLDDDDEDSSESLESLLSSLLWCFLDRFFLPLKKYLKYFELIFEFFLYGISHSLKK